MDLSPERRRRMPSRFMPLSSVLALGYRPPGQRQHKRVGPKLARLALLKPLLEIQVPDSVLARDAAEAISDTEGELLFLHSMRVYCWAALAGGRKGMAFDQKLLFVAAMFHDYGLTARYGDSNLRYEVDGANAARAFLRSHGISEADSQSVWLAIALHTTNGISPHRLRRFCRRCEHGSSAPALATSLRSSGALSRWLTRVRCTSPRIFCKPSTTA